MGRFERSDRGGGQVDPGEALRRAREAVARERARREEERRHDPPAEDAEVERVEDALRERDEHAQDDSD